MLLGWLRHSLVPGHQIIKVSDQVRAWDGGGIMLGGCWPGKIGWGGGFCWRRGPPQASIPPQPKQSATTPYPNFLVCLKECLMGNSCEKQHLTIVETACGNPYNTCRLWRLLGAISGKVTGNHQKSIRFFSKTERDFAESKNLIKPCENQHFAKTENGLRKPL